MSFALGAFFAGMILSESELSQRAASETLPLRDAFAVLFFVSVGMLVDPMIVVNDPGWLLATLLIIVIGKSLAAFAIVRLFGYPTSHALTISASLAQIGEFSFILAGLGVSLALLPRARSRPDPGRRHPVDPAQPGAVRPARLVPGQGQGRRIGRRPAKPPPSRPCASRSGRPSSPTTSCWWATAGSGTWSATASGRTACRCC